jgi:hypothetical protein
MIDRVRDLVGSPAVTGEPGSPTTGTSRPSGPTDSEQQELRRRFSLDPATTLARFTASRLGPAVLSCTERRNPSGGASTLCLVVERDAAGARTRLESLRSEFCARLGDDPAQLATRLPVLEVIDSSTLETIERLIASGFLLRAEPRDRQIALMGEPTPAPLTREEVERCQAGQVRAQHALRRARVLGEAGFEPECRGSLAESLLHLAGSLAVLHRLPEPASIEAALADSHRSMWRGTDPILRDLLADPPPEWATVAKALDHATLDLSHRSGS